MKAEFKVDAWKAREMLVYIANKIFKQRWTVAPERIQDNSVGNEETEETQPKKRKLLNLDHQLPDRITVAKYLSDFSLLSFTVMAERIVNSSENETIT